MTSLLAVTAPEDAALTCGRRVLMPGQPIG
jgi:hypothetical protein